MCERSLTDLFHRLGQIIPEEQELVVVRPDTPARDALALMRKHNVSQLPIVANNTVLGVFSYRSFAEGLLQVVQNEREPIGLPVEVFSEDLHFAQVSDELQALLDEFELKDAVLVGSENRLQGIATTVDALRYFYKVASPFVMLAEIELAIRELLRASLHDEDITDCIDRSLRQHYEEKGLRAPSSLEDLSLSDYINIIRFKGSWGKFRDAFGGSYCMAAAKLERLPQLRNDVFHFRRELTVEEYDLLRDRRDWLLKRILKLDATKGTDK